MSLEKLPKMDNYDRNGNLDEHIEHMDTMINYHNARSFVK